MEFSALPVGTGDAFLLEHNNKYILVDGGMNKKKIIKLLDKKSIPKKHIHLIVCTHYDADHISGILGILKSNYTFDELWLPEILGKLSYTVNDNISSIINRLRVIEKTEDECDFDKDKPYEEISSLDLEGFTREFYYEIRYPCYYRYRKNKYYKLLYNVGKIRDLVSRSISSGSQIRWLAFVDYETNEKYCKDINLYGKNSLETKITPYSKIDMFLEALYLTEINAQSLVFLFDQEDLPNVLFSADSDLSFLKDPIKLKENSIVTAPHHGSESSKNAYDLVEGEKLVYVRSDKSYKGRPGKTYRKLPNKKYCTTCRKKEAKQEIILTYRNNEFKTPSSLCECNE